jgi:hypothetical protein
MTPDPKQALLIFSMLLGDTPEEREPVHKGKVPNFKKELLEARFVTTFERTVTTVVEAKPSKGKSTKAKPSKPKTKTKTTAYLRLTSTGQDWALENLLCDLPNKGQGPRIRERIREALAPLLREHRSDVIGRLLPSKGAEALQDAQLELSEDDDITVESIQQQIREAYLSLTNGRTKERVLLKDLRPKVAAVAADFNEAVLELQNAQKVVLMGLDNMAERTAEVEAAALHIAGNPRHLVYFQG